MEDLRHLFNESDRWQAQIDIMDLREYILPLLMKRQGNVCNICKLEVIDYDIDHIVYNPKVTINELQALCWPCHKNKTDFRSLKMRK